MNDICILGTSNNAVQLMNSIQTSKDSRLNCIAEINYQLWDDSKDIPIYSLGKASQLYHSGKIRNLFI